MHTSALLVRPEPGWALPLLEQLHPGATVAVFADAKAGLEARRAGLIFRDTFTVLSPGGLIAMVLLLRAPFKQKVVAQALMTGSGAMYIDGCRVSSTDKYNRAPASSGFTGIYGYKLGSGRASDSSSVGRWPTNVVLVHGEECVRAGTIRVAAPSPARRKSEQIDDSGSHEGWKRPGGSINTRHSPGYGDKDGKETVAAWNCQSDCPVARLDSQSGVSRSNTREPTGRAIYPTEGTSMIWNPNSVMDNTKRGFVDSGGASRFYPQFASEAELLGWVATLLGGNPLGVTEAHATIEGAL